MLVGSLCRGGRGSFPQLLDIQGPSQTLKDIAPIQKISVYAAILEHLELHRINSALSQPLLNSGVSLSGDTEHISTVHIFGITSWRAGRPCPTAPLAMQFSGEHGPAGTWLAQMGLCPLTLSQPSPRAACHVQ